MHRLLVGLLVVGWTLSVSAAELGPVVTLPQLGPATICFTSGRDSAPGGDCTALIVDTIGQAQQVLLVQAYNFSEPHIIDAIIAAKHRGVAVTLILDKTSATQRGEGADAVAAAGVPVYVDRRPRIAHNKIMIIDGKTVITGSFNFTASAQCCNAENLLILHSSELAAAYAANFMHRQAVSVAFAPADGEAAMARRAAPPALSQPY
jgi:phosphatidylserine/phosphatidylglycerophosphate/cardiolipin synthase-like enzyme